MNREKYYWYLIFVLLSIPLTNSFVTNLQKMIKSVMTYNQYKSLRQELFNENMELNSKLEYYKTPVGIKSLIKDRLNKVEEGEVIVKFKDRIKD